MGDVIKNGDTVILQRFDQMKICKLIKGGHVHFGRQIFDISNCEGDPFGSTYETKASSDNKKYFFIEKAPNAFSIDCDDVFGRIEDETASELHVLDNRFLNDTKGDSQKLTHEDIEAMRNEGQSGTQIVNSLITNSNSFDCKTRYSQAKFVNKKTKKHCQFIAIRRPSIRLLISIGHTNHPDRISNLRIDTLSQIINLANIHSGGNYIVAEAGSGGLVVSAALERIGCFGSVVHVYLTGQPLTRGVDDMNFTADVLKNLYLLNVHHLQRLAAGEDIVKLHAQAEANHSSTVSHRQLMREKSSAAFAVLKKRDAHGLIVAVGGRHHPTSVLLYLLSFLAPSCPFVVFCPHREPLLNAYMAVKELNCAILVCLTEPWLRKIQILPGRTHPDVTMSGSGGFILSGIKVESKHKNSLAMLTEDYNGTNNNNTQSNIT